MQSAKAVSSAYLEAAEQLLEELLQLKLQVCKIQTDRGYVRVVVCPNPRWYSKLCRQFEVRRRNRRWKRPRTLIKRVDTIAALRRFLTYGMDDTVYVQRLMPHIRERVKQLYHDTRIPHACHSRLTGNCSSR